MGQKVVLAADGTPASERAVEFLAGYRGDPAALKAAAHSPVPAVLVQ